MMVRTTEEPHQQYNTTSFPKFEWPLYPRNQPLAWSYTERLVMTQSSRWQILD